MTARLRTAWRSLRWTLLACIGIAVFLTVLLRDGLWRNLVFSLCVGLTIHALIEGGRHGIVRALRACGRDSPELRKGWPGWRWMAGWVPASALVGYGVGMTLGGWLIGVAVEPFAWAGARALFIVLSITLIVSLAITRHFLSEARLAQAQADAQAAARLASEHQLRLLQSQLEPHMLFNTLANLRVLIGLDAVRAQAMLDHLIAYLRATLAASRRERHPLATEFERLDDYLTLMAIRMGARLQVQLDLPAALRAVPVPPLLLQPLVENSIRHGLEPQVQGGRIAVAARRDGDTLQLTVRDTGVGLEAAAAAVPRADEGGGFGSTQVRQRLQALYGDGARFTLAPGGDAEGGTLATLCLPWPGDAAPADPDPDPVRDPVRDPGPRPATR
ncbi:MAG: histidine kinase [Rubrivivax sp. SCN 71-131]|nr:MAG: histidine kinase [Rubrivivax sp. SCN 71-131]